MSPALLLMIIGSVIGDGTGNFAVFHQGSHHPTTAHLGINNLPTQLNTNKH